MTVFQRIFRAVPIVLLFLTIACQTNLQSIAQTKPPDFVPPKVWTPPKHVEADSDTGERTYVRVDSPRSPRMNRREWIAGLFVGSRLAVGARTGGAVPSSPLSDESSSRL